MCVLLVAFPPQDLNFLIDRDGTERYATSSDLSCEIVIPQYSHTHMELIVRTLSFLS